jgi:hypothetical protein
MPRDARGDNWMTVRYTADVQVIAETVEDALRIAARTYRIADLADNAQVVEE